MPSITREDLKVGQEVWIKSANSWGRHHLPPGKILVKVIQIRETSFYAETVNFTDDYGRPRWNYKFNEILVPKQSPRTCKFIGGNRVVQF